MMRLPAPRSLATLAAAAMLAGCAVESGLHSGTKGARHPAANEVPLAANFPTTTQLKLQAAEHWNRVANDTAQALVKSLRGNSVPIHVRRTCEASGCAPRPCDTSFNRVFHNELVSALVNAGHRVLSAPAPNAIEVELDIQAVAFAPNRPQYRYAGRAVELGPGVWALRDVTSLVESDGVAAPRTDGADSNWYRAEFAAGRTPRNELVVTASALSPQGTYLARNTAVYYTADADAAHYFCPDALAAAARTRVWTIPVTGDCSSPRCVQEGRGP